jgi:hypothetical protein
MGFDSPTTATTQEAVLGLITLASFVHAGGKKARGPVLSVVTL